MTARDATGIQAKRTVTYSVVDRSDPLVTVSAPAEGEQVVLGSSVRADYACTDEPGGSGLASCEGSVADGAAVDTSSIGPKQLTVTARDGAGNVTEVTRTYVVIYDFRGFFAPVDAPLNRARAGSAIPVKLSLGGDQGSGVLAAGSPLVRRVACPAAAFDGIEETVASTASGLRYDTATEQYVYVWKTGASWAGTCRELVVTLADGTAHLALFQFLR